MHACVPGTRYVGLLCIFVYLYFVETRQYITADFGSSLSEAVLKFYPATDEASTVSSACLHVTVEISSPAVQLVIAVSDMSEDNTKSTSIKEVRSDNSVIHRQQVSSGNQSFTILRGRQYLIFTARKIRITRASDRVRIHSIRFNDRPCENITMRKYFNI